MYGWSPTFPVFFSTPNGYPVVVTAWIGCSWGQTGKTWKPCKMRWSRSWLLKVWSEHRIIAYLISILFWKSELPDGYRMKNTQKYKYVTYITPCDMMDEEYLSLQGKGNLTQEVKSSPCSLIMDHGMPPVWLGYLVVCISYTLKVFSTSGMFAKKLQWQRKPSIMHWMLIMLLSPIVNVLDKDLGICRTNQLGNKFENSAVLFSGGDSQ